mgnify:CR=1 FL=1
MSMVDAAVGGQEGDRTGGEVHHEVGDCGREWDALSGGSGFALGGGGAGFGFRGVILRGLLFVFGGLDWDNGVLATLRGGEDVGGCSANEGPSVFAEGADEGGDLVRSAD